MPGSRVAPSTQQRVAEAARGAGALLERRAAGPAPRRTARASRRPTGSRSSAMPFCGPKVLVAPNSPVSGLSTSLAATSRDPADPLPGRRHVDRRSTPVQRRRHPRRGARRRWRPARPAARRRRRWCRCRPARPRRSSRRRRPRRRPARPRRTSWRSSAPSPPVRCSPQACALSTYAVSPTTQHRGRRRRAVRAADGHARAARRRAPRAARRRSRGRRRTSAPGRARRPARPSRQPAAIASAASTAVRVPANLSGRDQDPHAQAPAAVRVVRWPTSARVRGLAPRCRGSTTRTMPSAPSTRHHQEAVAVGVRPVQVRERLDQVLGRSAATRRSWPSPSCRRGSAR